MEAKPIAGEHGRFCGDASAALVKTPCCQQWICCDTAFLSFRGDGRCQVEHERLSMCYSHYEDKHGGPWETCQQCRDFWSPRDDRTSAENPIGSVSVELIGLVKPLRFAEESEGDQLN
jgi:hypothetical protein